MKHSRVSWQKISNNYLVLWKTYDVSLILYKAKKLKSTQNVLVKVYIFYFKKRLKIFKN